MLARARMLLVFMIVVLVLMPTHYNFTDNITSGTTPTSTTQPQIHLRGVWGGTDEYPTYTLANMVVNFEYGMTLDQRVRWAKIFDQAIELLPEELVELVSDIGVTFTSVGICDNSVLGCFYSIPGGIGMRSDTMSGLGDMDVLQVLIHELGHAVDFKLGSTGHLFEDLYVLDQRMPTNYARTNVAEDFAESFFTYVMYPSKLKQCCVERYKFLRDNVFGGIEYDEDFPSTPLSKNRFGMFSDFK